jgi:DNA polymerase-1
VEVALDVGGSRQDLAMRVLLSTGDEGGWSLQPLDDEGRAVGPVTVADDVAGLVAVVAAIETGTTETGTTETGTTKTDAIQSRAIQSHVIQSHVIQNEAIQGERPRWVWASTAAVYPLLLRAGVRIERCHDVAHTEALLSGHEERPWPSSGGGSPEDGRVDGRGAAQGQASLFDSHHGAHLGFDRPARGLADDTGNGDRGALERLRAAHADQLARIERARSISAGFPLLVAAESAAALAAVELGQVGLPWRADVHDRTLIDLLGERPRHGGRPPKLQELANAVATALDGPQRTGAPQLNVDSPLEMLRAFRRQGVLLETTRAHELRTVDHPAVEPLLRYKELARLHVAHGWAWRDAWVRDGRFRAEYVPAGVVSGRWATRGGGALQIPRSMRSAVIADPGWVLVVADAGQLEPRILAALSDDPGMVAATQAGDLYAALAAQALGRPEARDEAKIALLSAMYGGGTRSPALAALRRRFPQALSLLETAARTGEDGGVVRSALGRTCPLPTPNWQQGSESVALSRSRARGRFTRNFVIQASAADWANVLVAGLRRRLNALSAQHGSAADTDADTDRVPAASRAELVFFQHDEVMVHAPKALTEAVIAAIRASGEEATRLVLGDRGVGVPLTGVPVASYADKR